MAKSSSNSPIGIGVASRELRLSPITRRRFVREGIVGAAGAGLALQGAGSVFGQVAAESRETGSITLDALLVTYFGRPIGTDGSVKYTFRPNYSITISFRSTVSPNLELRANVSPDGRGVGQGVWEFESARSEGALTLYQDLRSDERNGVIAGPPNEADVFAFYGFFRPIVEIKGDEQNASFRFTEVGGTFLSDGNREDPLANAATVNSWKSQYILDPAELVPPRYIFAGSSGSTFVTAASAEKKVPKGLTARTTARILSQTGFQSDALKRAFAVGSDLEITYHARQDSNGKVLDVNAELTNPVPHVSQFYWDRIFRTFVII